MKSNCASHRTITNVGDITFKFDLLQNILNINRSPTLLQKHRCRFFTKILAIEKYTNLNAWQKAPTDSKQPVIRQYVFDNTTSTFEIDVYENSASLADLNLTVFLNNELKLKDVDYELGTSPNNFKTIKFLSPAFTSRTGLTIGDKIIIKTTSSAQKNDNGYYDFSQFRKKSRLIII